MKIRQMVQLGLLSATAIILHFTENWLSLPAPVPGIKLGLANSVALFAITILDIRSALYITAIRIVLGSLIGGSFLGPAFAMSAAGGIGSVLVMGYAYRHWRPSFSIIGVSIIGAVAHSIIQVVTAAILVTSGSLLWYVPYVVLLAVPAGIGTGFTSVYFLRRMPSRGS